MKYLASSGVPEPSTRALMIPGFTGLGFMRHRRKSSRRSKRFDWVRPRIEKPQATQGPLRTNLSE
ncbi:PEP-CTERM sorting domain-containing protein [Bradyrhizobium sp. AUGA SZCCT0283]|jgi:hypothetical protein|uniref:PEP-CTERM sorting domain-containing protein n=1 Tax=Bradyrhizobium sp. AUGA SZCCT0283 TaxID=2807671 RepID=UPI001BACEAC4|nr:PEP-CTERM sorting domain-containing protein [Bradyrhizobium sp. AUGA SZCCT0283]MBR1274012.1 PEP-CTERM sorting domain-containing protein [Bradyrhizobium sp. AUGA SZCCT0283]